MAGITINVAGQPIALEDVKDVALWLDKTRKTDTSLLDMLYPRRPRYDGKDKLPVGEGETRLPLAPFVDPLVQARPIATGGRIEAYYVPAAYLKPATPLTIDNVLDMNLLAALREDGIINGLSLSDGDRWVVAQIAGFKHNHDSIDNRVVLMALDVLLRGKTTYLSDDHTAVEVDYRRDPAAFYTPLVKWTENNATPVTDIQAMVDLSISLGGGGAVMFLTTTRVMTLLTRSAEFKERYVAPAGAAGSPIVVGLTNSEGVVYRGTLDGVPIYTYDAVHYLNGGPERFIPAGYFGVINNTNGMIAQCMIKHRDAYGQALQYFDYMAQQNDPGIDKLITDSSPLVMPGAINGVIGGNML